MHDSATVVLERIASNNTAEYTSAARSLTLPFLIVVVVVRFGIRGNKIAAKDARACVHGRGEGKIWKAYRRLQTNKNKNKNRIYGDEWKRGKIIDISILPQFSCSIFFPHNALHRQGVDHVSFSFGHLNDVRRTHNGVPSVRIRCWPYPLITLSHHPILSPRRWSRREGVHYDK